MSANIPEESEQMISLLCQKHHQKKVKLVRKYWEFYHQDFIEAKLFGSKDPITERHHWAMELLKADLSSKRIIKRQSIIPIGKGPISSYKDQPPTARVWILDLALRKIAVIDIPTIPLQFNVLNDLQLFGKYSNIPITSAYNRYLKTNHRILPLSIPKVTPLSPSEFMKKLQIPVVKMEDMKLFDVLSTMTSKGYYLASDIRCIKNCYITYSKLHERNIEDFKYQIGNISITDQTTDEYTTEHGIVVPSNFFCWVHPDFVYPVNSIGDAYGVLKIKGKSKVVLDLCYFDVIHEGEEEEGIEVSQFPLKPVKIKKKKKSLI